MNRDEMCSEQEAIRIAGVSARTLLRFCESGYLNLHATPDGSRMYERRQVEEIFGTPSAHCEPAPDITADDTCTAGEQTSAHPPSAENLADSSQMAGQQATECLVDSPERPAQATNFTRMTETQHDGSAEEIVRLRNLLAIQERILDSKDDEIADLRSQRAWLRERIERLEEKSDRDQILLLSETQTIRSLIAYQESRKSAVRQLLEWAGLVKSDAGSALPQAKPNDFQSKAGSSHSGSRTIEVAKAANSD